MLTEIESLKKTIAMWTVLADNPYKHKWDYLEEHPELGKPTHDCFLCEFAGLDSDGHPRCRRCPLKGKWVKDKRYVLYACEVYGSPYTLWQYDITSVRIEGALAIVRLCEEKLDELRKTATIIPQEEAE